MAVEVAKVDQAAARGAGMVLQGQPPAPPAERAAPGTEASGAALQGQPGPADGGRPVERAELEKALRKMTLLLLETPVRLSFRIHEGSGRMMVQVVDGETGEVIKEIPPREILDTVARIMQFVGLLLDRKM